MLSRRSSSRSGADTAAGDNTSLLPAGSQLSHPEQTADSSTTSTAVRQQSGRRRSSDPSSSSDPESAAAAAADAAASVPAVKPAAPLTPLRARVTQQPPSSTSSSAAAPSQQQQQQQQQQRRQVQQQQPDGGAAMLQQAAGADSTSSAAAVGQAAQGAGKCDTAAVTAAAAAGPTPTRTRQPAALKQQQQAACNNASDQLPLLAAAAASSDPAAEHAVQADVAEQQQEPQHSPVSTPVKHSCLLSAGHKTLRFEVYPAPGDGGVDFDGHDQQQLPGSAAGTAQQQQYTYHEATGQLQRLVEGADGARLARHYLEDWNTGDFFQLSQPSSGCLAWLRRKPRGVPPPRPSQAPDEEPSALRSLADFTDSMGSAMAALGLFAQGLAGGLALLCLFMTYLSYGSRGRDGFLAYYSPLAQLINRAFFTLISLSLVAACSRLGFDSLGSYQPGHLRLRLVDYSCLALYLLAYSTNLIATPTDDQLAYEAGRDPAFWALQLPGPFLARLAAWHALNLVRLVACGLAWALVCYRSNPYVMMAVFEARRVAGEADSGDELVLRLGTPAAAAAAVAAGEGSRGGGSGGGSAAGGPERAAAAAQQQLFSAVGAVAAGGSGSSVAAWGCEALRPAAAVDRQQQAAVVSALALGTSDGPAHYAAAAAAGGNPGCFNSSAAAGAAAASPLASRGIGGGRSGGTGIGSGRLAPGAAVGWGAVY